MEFKRVYEGRRVCVTGGAGFIGSHLCRTLVELGAEVAVIDDLSSGTLENLEAITRDLRRGRGFLGRTLTDPVLAERVDDLAAAIDALGSVAKSIDDREGAIGALLVDDGPAEEAITELRREPS